MCLSLTTHRLLSTRSNDRILSRYEQRRRMEAAAPPVTQSADVLASQLDTLQISRDPPSPLEEGFTIGPGGIKCLSHVGLGARRNPLSDPQP